MRPYLLIPATWFLLPVSMALGQQRVDVRRAATPDASLRISGSFGALRIIGWTKDSVVVTGTIPPDARFETAMGSEASAPLHGGKMYLEMPDGTSSSSARIEMRVPVGARVWAKGGDATIDAEGVTGALDLNIVGGSVHVVASPRELNVESMDGSVLVEGSPAWVRLKTADGDITMHGSSEDAGFTTVSGVIRTGGGRLERARLESVTGAIEFSADPVRGGSITFDSHSGPIELRLDPRAPAEIDATTLSGTIENLLTRTRPAAGRNGRGQELATSVGDPGGGGAQVTIRTFKGQITLTSR